MLRARAPFLAAVAMLVAACANPAGTAPTAELASSGTPATSARPGASIAEPAPTRPDRSADTTAGRPPASSTTTASGVPTAGAALAPGPVTIVALGDSLTEGAGDDDAHGYPERLQTHLDQGPRSGSTVVNLGLSGWDSQQVLDGQDGQPSQMSLALPAIADAVAKGQPVLALVLVGSNDLWYCYANDAPTTEEEEQENLATYRRNLSAIASGLRGAGATVVLAINDDQSKRPVASDPAMREATFSAISADEVQMMSGQARRYAGVVREVAAANGAVVVDFLEAPFFSDRTMLADDGNHPNKAGYDAMTAIWLAALEPMLGSGPGG